MDDEFKISDDQKHAGENAFKQYDAKDNGKISVKEINNAFKLCGTTLKGDWLDRYSDEIDQDGTGYITSEEFIMLYTEKLRQEADERDLREAFRVLDKKNQGVIPVADLRWILRSLGDDLTDEDIEDMINDTDTDGSGTVDFDEFAKLMMG